MKPIDVLFLCETNAATSLMAEALVNHRNDLRIRAFSAGRAPAAAMLGEARQQLTAAAIPTDGLEPKAWSIFTFAGAPRPDLIVDLATVTWTLPELRDLADGPVLRWPLRDAALVEMRRERKSVAEAVFRALRTRIETDLMPLLTRSAMPRLPQRAVADLTM